MSWLTVEECELLGDAKYRSYITQMEKILLSFDCISEPTDVISALGRLNKILLSNLRYPVIPKKLTVGKCLAQCLHPSLPSSVHVKALETYDIIFKCIGTQRLAHDLFIYSVGLFPLLRHVAMSVKPVLLTVYEMHFVPLGAHMKPGLNGLLLGLLPGLEEGAEFYDRTNMLLEDICDAVGLPYFCTCVWECVLSCPNARLSGTLFLLNHLRKLHSLQDQLLMIGLSTEVMVDAVCTCLHNGAVVIQRNLLDFLHLAVPLDCPLLKRADFIRIMEAAVGVVICRDGSLSRRFYAWVLGKSTFDSYHSSRQSINDSSITSERGIDYFKANSKDVLISALKAKLTSRVDSFSMSHFSNSSAVLNVLKILITFMNKPEIGSVIIEDVLLSVLQHLEVIDNHYTQSCAGSENGVVTPSSSLQMEIHKTVNGLIALFQPGFIWDYLAHKFSESLQHAKRNTEYSGCDGPVEGLLNEKRDREDSGCEDPVKDLLDEKMNRQDPGCGDFVERLSVFELCRLTEHLLDIVSMDTHPETSTQHLPNFLKKITSLLTTACTVITLPEVTVILCLCSKILSKIRPYVSRQQLRAASVSGSSHSMNFTQKKNSAVFEKQDFGRYHHKSSSIYSNSQKGRASDGFYQKGRASRIEKSKDLINVKVQENGNCIGDTNNNQNSDAKLHVSPRDDKQLNNSYSYSHEEDESCIENIYSSVKTQPTLNLSGIENKLLDSVILNADGKIVVASSGDLVSAATPALEPDVIRPCVTNEERDIPSTEFSQRKQSKQISGDSEMGVCLGTSNCRSSCCSLFQLCFTSFQQFFHKFCQLNILTLVELYDKCMRDLTSMSSSSSCFRAASARDAVEKFKLEGSVDEVVCAYRQACRLLVDFAACPVNHVDSDVACPINHVDSDVILEQISDNKERNLALPDWLQDLLICSCFVDSFDIQSVSVSSVLDLVSQSRTIQKELETAPSHQGQQLVSDGQASLVLLPGILPHHLSFINQETRYYQVVAQELWEYMSEAHIDCHQKAAELLHTLHQVAPDANVCEDVIGCDLIHESEVVKILAFKKFSMLWHLTRTMPSDLSLTHSPRTFDRSMFVMLDSLKEESSITQTLALTWLTHVVQQGDINRVLQPLLLMLLHPDTARVSIQHVDLYKAKKVSLFETKQMGMEAELYPITSQGSYIQQESQGNHRQLTNKQILQNPAEDLKLDSFSEIHYMYASTEQTYLNANIYHEQDTALANSFGSQNSLDKLIFNGNDYPQATAVAGYGTNRLESNLFRKDSLEFNKSNTVWDRASGDDSSLLEVTKEAYRDSREQSDYSCTSSQDVVRWILDGIIDSAMVEAVDFDKLDEGDSEGEKTLEPSSSSGSLDSISDDENGGSQRLFTAEDECFNFTHNSDRNERSFGFDENVSKRIKPHSADARAWDAKMDVQQLHEHMLLYLQKFDCRRTMFAMSTLRTMLQACPRLLVTALSTTSISSLRAPLLLDLQSLLGRHHRTVFGDNFFRDLDPEAVLGFRSKMYIEIIIILCLRFMQSYYSNLVTAKLSNDDLHGNQMVQMLSAEVLTLLVSELLAVMKDSGWNFVSYISDLLSRCRLQKMVLHRLLASVYDHSNNTAVSINNSDTTDRARCIQAVVDFSEKSLDPDVRDTFQMKLLQLVQVVIKLQDHMCAVDGESSHPIASERRRPQFMDPQENLHYNPSLPIIQQDMLLSAILASLRQRQLHRLHTHWLHLVTSVLPHMGQALPRVVLSVVLQLSTSLEMMTSDIVQKMPSIQRLPPDYIVCMLEGLTTLFHYCLVDSANPVSICQPAPAGANIPVETPSAGQILSNLIHVFNPVTSEKEPSPTKDTVPASPVFVTRVHLLSLLPRVVACMAGLWKAITTPSSTDDLTGATDPKTVGDVRAIRHQILELLSPISLTHGSHFLAAFAVAWNDRRQTCSSSVQQPVQVQTCRDQLLLVELVGAIRVLPVDTLIQTVKQVIKQPPPTELTKKDMPLEVNLLQFFWAFVHHSASSSQLLDSWPSLLALLKECLQMNLSPPAIFLLLQILNEIVQKTPPMEEKRSQKDLQEICQRTLESVGAIAGSSLEQRAWLRRNYAVKVGSQAGSEDGEEALDDAETKQEASAPRVPIRRSQVTDSRYSVQALLLLAELTAQLLDVVYASDEKFKVAPFLTTLLYNVFPYLRNHSVENVPSFRACSQILANISGYQYTRKAWRRETFEMLLSPAFFQMDGPSIASWRVIIDHLMTHDKTTFRDLLGRASVTQSASLNLFTTKEQGCDLRALMMKRLAFAIFCSEADQYQRAMPEIQERLTECLRMPQQAHVMTSAFLCFRVLILRMSPQHLLSLWPTIITEMVHVLLQIEQELSVDTEDFKIQIEKIAALDSSWAHLANGLNAHNNPVWLQLYLSACKLLDLCLALPADRVPQFQLYRWAFVGTADMESCQTEDTFEETCHYDSYFTPHISRLSHLLNSKLNSQPALLKADQGRPLLTLHRLRTLAELQPFFNTLCDWAQKQGGQQQKTVATASASPLAQLTLGNQDDMSASTDGTDKSRGKRAVESNKVFIEKLLEMDFLEPLS
ncbi:hypothetical protein BsWGS_28261 [Bradybaena similaris]